MSNVGVDVVGDTAAKLLDIVDRPTIDWVSIARRLRGPGGACGDDGGAGCAYDRALATEGPALIEVVL